MRNLKNCIRPPGSTDKLQAWEKRVKSIATTKDFSRVEIQCCGWSLNEKWFIFDKRTGLYVQSGPMIHIRPFRMDDLEAIRRFTDQEIGVGYYSATEISDIFKRSQKDGVMCSFLLEDDLGGIKGVRISYPAGGWTKGKGKGLNPQLWPHPFEQTAYFQSLFLSSDLQGQGWGGKASQKSMEALRETGALGIVCHSWKESPNGSSSRYLQKLGFQLIAEHPQYCKEVPYNCTRCGSPPCLCTAQEMYLNLERIL